MGVTSPIDVEPLKAKLPETNALMIDRKVNQFCLTCNDYCFVPTDLSNVSKITGCFRN